MKNPANPIFRTVTVNGHTWPGIWLRMLPEDVQWMGLPRERFATCDNCPKVATGEFKVDCKCCTHYPEVSNFMLGLALKDPRYRPIVEQLVQSGHGLPESLQVPPGRLFKAIIEYGIDGFGNSREILCPFMDSKTDTCGIYPYRNSICATFFCAHDHGELGDQFWEKMQSLLGQVEISLSQWAMEKVGMDSGAYFGRLDSLAEDIDSLTDEETGGWSLSARKHLFGEWFDREVEFYEGCADAILEALNDGEDLYQIACAQDSHMAFKFERAVRACIPEDGLIELDPLPDNPGEAVPVEDLWYKVQLGARHLWALPYNEGKVIFNTAMRIEPNSREGPLFRHNGDRPFVVMRPSKKEGEDDVPELFMTADEARALRVFESPQVIGEALIDSAEMKALSDSKGFLAECMRCEILIEV